MRRVLAAVAPRLHRHFRRPWRAAAATATLLLLVAPLMPWLWATWRCSRQSLHEPLWSVEFGDWRERAQDRFALVEQETLRRFLAEPLGSAQERRRPWLQPLLVTHATMQTAQLVHHWACRARAAALEPRVIALDGAATCAHLRQLAPWLPCLALLSCHECQQQHQHNASSSSSSSSSSSRLAAQQRALLREQLRLVWRILAAGYDALFSAPDVVFMPNASLRIYDFVDSAADVQTLEAGVTGHLRGAALRWAVDRLGWHAPRFGLVLARANKRTVALFQLLHGESARDGSSTLSVCARPWRRLTMSHFPRRFFVDGPYWGRHEHEYESVQPGFNATWPRSVAAHVERDSTNASMPLPVAVYLGVHERRDAVATLRRWALWTSTCGNDRKP